MTRKIYITTIITLLLCAGIAQGQNNYRSETNPYYWKNKMPFAGYWQQDVYYKINADLSEKTDIITATETLEYFNNSPDTLPFVYFHLYQNAFVKGSHLSDLEAHNNVKVTYGRYEAQGLGTAVSKMQVNGVDCKTELDNCVLKVYLPRPLLPGKSTTFDIAFKTYFDDGGNVRRRMKLYKSFGYKHYNGVHWYPRICVYDRKKGWDTDQHLNREFYGDYGSFDVSLTVANNMVLDATGVLQNRKEVLPDSLRAKLDIKNFAKKPWGSAPSVITKYDSTIRKTWRFHADNVHDWGFTADPTYRIGESAWNGIQTIALAQEQHASRWQNAATYTASIIATNSRDFGMYIWPKIIVADAEDGMEYPMMTLDGGADPSYRSLLAHEVSHQWFFGMLGNNETYRAMMDEGFTQFATIWLMDALEGGYETRYKYKNKYYDRYKKLNDYHFARMTAGYMLDAVADIDEPINQHSDAFNGALGQGGGYRQVYFKTATMLYNLQYVLGDSLFLRAMKNYVAQWKCCHPYPEDFRNSVIHYTHVDLNWFFDEWIETTKKIDYKVTCVHKEKDGWYNVDLARLGRMQMPIDLTVYDKKGGVHSYYIPNDWFQKSTNATILPKWYGWDKLHPTYTAHIQVPQGIRNVVIDTTHRMADVNLLNNSSRFPYTLHFEHFISNTPDPTHYEMTWRPDIWGDAYDGLQVGLNLSGSYLHTKHVFSVTVWYNTALLQNISNQYNFTTTKPIPVSFHATYSNTLSQWQKGLAWNAEAYSWAGVYGGHIGLTQQIRNNTIAISWGMLYRPDTNSLNYALYPGEWSVGQLNSFMDMSYTHNYAYHTGNGDWQFSVRTPGVASAFNYSWARFNEINTQTLGKAKLRTRFIAQYGTGTNWAPESYLWLAGGNPETQIDDKFARAVGFMPEQWQGFSDVTNHFQEGGGLDLRGFAGYYAIQTMKDGSQNYLYRGMSGAAINAELEFQNYIPFKPRITRNWLHADLYVFGDGGVMLPGNNVWSVDAPRIDAGLGAAFTIKHFSIFETIKPFTIRIDFPLLITPAPYAESGNFKFRYVVGINRAF